MLQLQEIELPTVLISYIPDWDSMVPDADRVEKFKDHPLKVRTADPFLWKWIFDVLRAHREKYNALSDEQRLTKPVDELPGLSTLSLHNHYTLLLIVHLQKISVLYAGVLDATANKLRSLSLAQLNTTHMLAPLATPFVPTTYKEKVAINYANWRHRVRQVLTHYLANNAFLIDALMSRLPEIGYLVGVGIGHSLVITRQGVYASGNNEYAQLGIPYEESSDEDSGFEFQFKEEADAERNVYKKHAKIQVSNALAVACGHSSSLILTSDGVYFAGENVLGQSGLGDDVGEIVLLTKVKIQGVLAIAMGQSHSMFLTTNGLFSAGNDRSGQLGLGNDSSDMTATPRKVVFVGGENIKAVFCGGEHTMMINDRGELFACGNNSSGQLGIGTTENTGEPTRVLLPNGTKVVSVALGFAHSLILTDEGIVYACGANSAFQLGTSDSENRSKPTSINAGLPINFDTVIAISAGGKHSLFLTSAGHVISVGSDKYGQLATGVSRSERYAAGLPKTFAGVLEMVSGGNSSFFISETGLYGVGENETGLLGLGDTKNVSVPTKVPLRLGHENTIEINVNNNKKKATDDIGADRKKKEQRLKCTVCLNEVVLVETPDNQLFCSTCFDNLFGY